MTSRTPADLLIAGAGLAGLSLAVALADAGVAGRRRVVVVDPRAGFARDRTWCAWHFDGPAARGTAADAEPFDGCVSREWPAWRVVGGGVDVTRSAPGVTYRHVAGDDFYRAALGRLSGEPGVELRLGVAVERIDDDGRGVTARLSDGSTVRAAGAFDGRAVSRERNERSSSTEKRSLRSRLTGEPHDVRLWQQFVGHFVTTARPAFDPGVVTLMDFRLADVAPGRAGDVRFAYVLPFAADRALVEATTIAGRRVEDGEHVAAIGDYLRRVVGVDRWEVTGTERGRIPMTTAPAPAVRSPNVWAVGVAGGMAKPSTGYAYAATLRFAREAARRVADADGCGPLRSVAPPRVRTARASALDAVFLSRLARRPDLAPGLFARLFDRAEPAALARFLSDAGTVADDLAVIAALPKLPFAAEAVRSWKRWARPRPRPPTTPRRPPAPTPHAPVAVPRPA